MASSVRGMSKHTHRVVTINLNNPSRSDFEHADNIVKNKMTCSRLLEVNKGVRGLIAETWYRQLLVTRSFAKLSSDFILTISLQHINMRTLSMKLVDTKEFINNEQTLINIQDLKDNSAEIV